MNEIDRDALRRALKQVRAKSPENARYYDHKLTHEPWFEVAHLAVYSCQCDALRLKPWQFPPCWMGDQKPVDDPNDHGLLAAWELRRRLIDAGLSMYEPDPIGALAAVAAPKQPAA